MDGKIDLSELNKNLKKINELRYNNNELSDTNKIVELPVTVELNGFYYKIKNDGTVIYSNQLETENIYSEEVKTLLNYGISIEFDDLNEDFISNKIAKSDNGLIQTKNDNNNILSSSVDSAEYDAYMAFDKNYGSYWCTAGGKQDNAYIGYNFNKKTYIKNVDVCSTGYRCKEVKLQCSNDNSTWIDASDVVTFENNNDIHTIESNIRDTAYQYWRVYVITGYEPEYTGIYECEFYGI